MGRKRKVPFERGKTEIWATAVVHAVGGINSAGDEEAYWQEKRIYWQRNQIL